ncbi:MAG: hypothetical protein J2P46_05190 [Zavarzinella sp.]|nr:hypothetical protein [Zavarzinella sp.]
MARKHKPKKLRPAELTEDQILKWADAYHKLTGRWPKNTTVPRAIRGAPAETWSAIHGALQKGRRGLPGGSSLARLLADRRGVRNQAALPPLTIRKILRWCDEFHARTGKWPQRKTSPRTGIPGSGGDKWHTVDTALRVGRRGLPGGSTLPRLLAEHRGVRNIHDLPPLTVRQVLAWADAWHERMGRWPAAGDWRDEIPGAPGETWGNVMQAIVRGFRGLPGGFTLHDLLAEHRGVRNINNLPPLSVQQILAWADAFHAKTGDWPTVRCSPQEIPGTLGERWFNVDQALRKGLRGLPGESSLSQLLSRHRGVTFGGLPRLTVRQILAWADAFRARTGVWPTMRGSPQRIDGSRGERWKSVDEALREGHRGLPGGSSLAKLLARHRGVPNIAIPMKYRMARGR